MQEDNPTLTAAGDAFNPDISNKLTKSDLINLVLQLKTEKEALQVVRQLLSDIGNCVIALERSQYLYEQYGRRESVEISGIPVSKTKVQSLLIPPLVQKLIGKF